MSSLPFAVGSVSGVAAPGLSVTSNAGPSQATKAAAGGSFESVLSKLSDTAVTNLKAGEAAAIAGIQGQATTREVVDAVMKAEQSLQTVIAVRDKVISAYQEISRMSI